MSGDRALAELVGSLLDPDVELRRYFGGWALRRAGVQIALVIDRLYVKVPADVAATWAIGGSEPFSYVSRNRLVWVESYWSAPEGTLDDATRLRAALAAYRAESTSQSSAIAPAPRVGPDPRS